jgi:hypothetical protein
VHPTLGILARFQAFFYASAFFQLDGVPPPAPARVTQTVSWLSHLCISEEWSKIMDEHRGPRFRMYMRQRKGALFMRRDAWERFILEAGRPVEIELDSTPLGGLRTAAPIVGTFADVNEDGSVVITVIREDPSDAPNIINIDKYDVWHNGALRAEYPQIVAHSDTDDDSALRSLLEDYVMIIPLAKDGEHHSPDVPARFKAILHSDENAS